MRTSLGVSKDNWERCLGRGKLRFYSQAGDNSKPYDLVVNMDVPFFILPDGAPLEAFI